MNKIIVLAVLLIIVGVGTYIGNGFIQSDVTITIKEKYVYTQVHSSDKSTWSTLTLVVVTSDGITYNVQYLPWEVFRNSQVLYGTLDVGKTYHIELWGIRIEWLGIFNNIYSFSEVSV